MFNWKEFEKTKAVLSQSKYYQDYAGQHHLTIRPVDLLKWIELLNDDLGFLTLVEIAGADLSLIPQNQYDFDLTYHFLNMGTHQRLNLHVLFDAPEIIPSIVSSYSHAGWMEREQAESFGINFSIKMNSLLYPENCRLFPLLKKEIAQSWPVDLPMAVPHIEKNPNKSEPPYPGEAYQWKSYDLFSPQSKAMFELQVCYDPVRVVDSQVNIGFHHQAYEKLLEKKDWQQVLQLVDKIHLGAAPTYSIAWAKTLEDLLRIKLPEKAQAIRIVFLELARIAEHLTVMQEITFALKLEEHKLFINCREKIYELMEKYCGRRQGLGIAQIGGIKEDLPHGWIVEYQTVCNIVTKKLTTIHRSLLSQPKFRDALSSGNVSAQTALEWGISGPAMRASGLNFDLRKSQPFYFYQDIDFDIPVGIHGSAYERYLIRFEETFQSFRIITQVIDNLPLGEFLNPDYDKGYPGIKEHLQSMDFPKGWHYTGLESPNGEAGFLVMFNNSSAPYRVKIKTPSYALTQALTSFIQGIEESQISSSLASIGLRSFEFDR